ncbi:MAG: hypothetical protein A6F71_09075 [Cycloclasticus sp. symbiont of Poecilosclerida sp. M]|nr:MAG: hypothetical protein A6F71_09075 [Cycloclasticus sp. symbiont of Poecilosclerida sp. M]
MMNQLPRPLPESELILSAVGVSQRAATRPPDNLWQAFLWLRANNPLYSNIPMPNQPQTNQTNQTMPADTNFDE